ncbi:hypothetical protein GYN24_02785 [Lactococcus piscium]|uniref:hypothetical protein n=1 Tax=Pseudolactococcus paracarnosus TaxID=2749962 RepID=UPI000D4D1ABB|nr:hypothetical protein [Lactococcus paracarnosus]MCJ1993509.1 hypothetical protein [Lactococcus paracarnosus]SPC35935.1 hypothetical protein LPICM02_230018 [Lactococcus piscium]
MHWDELAELEATVIDGMPSINYANGHLFNVLMASKVYNGIAFSTSGNIYVASNFS